LECFLETTPNPSLILPFKDRFFHVCLMHLDLYLLLLKFNLSPSYTDIDKIKTRINSNVERMTNANIERMMRMVIKQFFQLASSSRESGTFSSQPEVNPKGHASSSSGGNPSEPVRKVNAVISLCSGREIDNQVRNPNEPCRYPHQFF